MCSFASFPSTVAKPSSRVHAPEGARPRGRPRDGSPAAQRLSGRATALRPRNGSPATQRLSRRGTAEAELPPAALEWVRDLLDDRYGATIGVSDVANGFVAASRVEAVLVSDTGAPRRRNAVVRNHAPAGGQTRSLTIPHAPGG